ncbi:MAG: sigma-70 factor domain-containing protein, partial [Dissulfurispiraceae bacterium]
MEKHFDLYDKGLVEQEGDYSFTGIEEIATIEIPAPVDAETIKETAKIIMEQEYDPLKAYIKNISVIRLLSRGEEVAIARQIETCEFKIFSAIFTVPFVLKKLAELGRLVKRGEAQLSEFVQDSEDMSDMSEKEVEVRKERFWRITESIHSIIRERERQKNAPAIKQFQYSKRRIAK